MLSTADLMLPNAWPSSNGQFTPKIAGRISHHRKSSLLSLDSAGPGSPFSQNTSNPHIGMTDSAGDGYHGLPLCYDDSPYYLSKSLSRPTHDPFYTSQSASVPDSADSADPAGYSTILADNKQRSDRGLLPLPELSIGCNRSRPGSVASSVEGNSPATPSLEQSEDDQRRRRNGEAPEEADEFIEYSSLFDDAVFPTIIPKLDRTDIYNDELYNPSFTITSASPPQDSQPSVSPKGMFIQRLQDFNRQHLAAVHSPVSSSSSKSSFCRSLPLASAAALDFTVSAQQLRERRKSEQDAQALQQQTALPKIISPEDVILAFNDVRLPFVGSGTRQPALLIGCHISP